jgi:hypothetical protein
VVAGIVGPGDVGPGDVGPGDDGPGPVRVVVFSSSPPIMSIAAEEDEHTIKARTPMIIGVLDIFIIYTDNKCKDQFRLL